jgi:histidyl-tRNA synthetase
MKYQAPRGTSDVLPADVGRWQRAEGIFRDVCRVHGYQEIRTPIFESTDLFARTSGESSEVVSKQMYTFDDRGGDKLTLRAEGTAPVVRAYIEHGLHVSESLFKAYYICPIFRYERPQKGRLREHHQFGIEAIGAIDPALDVEVIAVAMSLFDRLGIVGAETHINSVGCPVCRPAYRALLRSTVEPHLATMCEDCRRRYDLNPMRILDCKQEQCQAAKDLLPHAVDHLCAECATHFAQVRHGLDDASLPYVLNHRLVRGLDYYTKTAFEFPCSGLGSQDALGGGGRYDGLVEECGGPSTPGIGFGIGAERVLIASAPEDESKTASRADVYVATAGDVPREYVAKVVRDLRAAGVSADRDYLGRSLKAQMKQANKYGVRYAIIIGEEEGSTERVTLRDLRTQEQSQLPLAEAVAQLSAPRVEGGYHTE